MSQATPCGPQPNCNNEVAELQDHCNGQGACQDAGTQTCAPYACDVTACATSCDPGAQGSCSTGYYCAGGQTGTGTCSPKLGNGQACTAANQCASGHCVDGVCCENACTGLCRACSSVKQGGGIDGLCLKVANFTDPDSECAGGRVCNDNLTAPGCTGVQQCNCSTPVFNQYQNCCSTCGQAECPSQINACNAQHGTYCTAIGNVDVYGAGQGVTDTNCPSGKRCGGLACTCVQ
jgi:hypothetical protein